MTQINEEQKLNTTNTIELHIQIDYKKGRF